MFLIIEHLVCNGGLSLSKNLLGFHQFFDISNKQFLENLKNFVDLGEVLWKNLKLKIFPFTMQYS